MANTQPFIQNFQRQAMRSPSCEDSQDDAAILRRFVAGERAALGVLAGRYERSLVGMAKGLLRGERDLACDAVQETWVRVIRFAHTFNGTSSVKTWLYQILINQCSTLRSTLKRERSSAAENMMKTVPASEPPALHDIYARSIRHALNQLDDDRHTIILLCYHHGMTHEQAAAILEIPLGTLKSRLHAALNQLRAMRVPAEHASARPALPTEA